MSEQQHIYAVLRSPADWDAAVGGDPSVWYYDKAGSFRVEPDVLAARCEPSIWTEAGKDKPPRGYPALAARALSGPPPAPSEEGAKRRKRTGRKVLAGARVVLTLPIEAPEQLDCLCEAYRLRPGEVVARLVAEAYRRDVVESGLLEALLDDETVIAPP